MSQRDPSTEQGLPAVERELVDIDRRARGEGIPLTMSQLQADTSASWPSGMRGY